MLTRRSFIRRTSSAGCALVLPYTWIPNAAAQAGAKLQDEIGEAHRDHILLNGLRDAFSDTKPSTVAETDVLRVPGNNSGVPGKDIRIAHNYMKGSFPEELDPVKAADDGKLSFSQFKTDLTNFCCVWASPGHSGNACCDRSMQMFYQTTIHTFIEGPTYLTLAHIMREFNVTLRQNGMNESDRVETIRKSLSPDTVYRRGLTFFERAKFQTATDVYDSALNLRVEVSYSVESEFIGRSFYRVSDVALSNVVTEGSYRFPIA